MRKKWFAFGCLTSFLLVVLLFSTLGYLGKKYYSDTVEIKPNSFLVLNLNGPIQEYSQIRSDFLGNERTSVHSLKKKIKAAAINPNIKGIILKPVGAQIGLASMNNLHNEIKDFKKSGKKVYAYLEFAGHRDYLLASVADKIFLNPSASSGILLTGLGGSRNYYKDTFEKIGVEFQVIHAGKYKGAGETYSRSSMSKPVRKNLNLLYTDLFENMKKIIAENREIGMERINFLYNERNKLFINQKYALETNLVDELKYESELYDELNLEKENRISFSEFKIDYTNRSPNKIAVIYAQGQIRKSADSYSDNILSAAKLGKAIKEIKEDPSIKAVVIRVNSPGGSALESDIMWKQIEDLKQKYPVVVSMGDVAASGGYFISSGADQVLAEPLTVTGSIGVVAMFPNLANLGEKIELKQDGITKGKYAELFNIWKPVPEENKAAIKSSIEQTYLEFKTRVSQGRKLTLEDVEAIAQGQVWSSNAAKDRKLIDNVGDLDDAIKIAADLANVSSYSEAAFPKRITLSQYLMKNKFNVQAISKVVNPTIVKELEIDKKYEFIKSIQEEPIQALLPFEVK